MKALVMITVVLLGSFAQARTLLNCSSIEQSDMHSLLVNDTATTAQDQQLELVVWNKEAKETNYVITLEDYNEGWIPLPDLGKAERYLIRQNDGWEIFSMVGDQNVTARAQCAESLF